MLCAKFHLGDPQPIYKQSDISFSFKRNFVENSSSLKAELTIKKEIMAIKNRFQVGWPRLR
jgi:hypothetical protein